MREELRYFEAGVPRIEKGNKTGDDNPDNDDTDRHANKCKK